MPDGVAVSGTMSCDRTETSEHCSLKSGCTGHCVAHRSLGTNDVCGHCHVSPYQYMKHSGVWPF